MHGALTLLLMDSREGYQLLQLTHSLLLQGLHYKDYHLVAPPALIDTPPTKSGQQSTSRGEDANSTAWSFEEIDTVKEFGKQMEERGVLEWWRKAMDFTN